MVTLLLRLTRLAAGLAPESLRPLLREEGQRTTRDRYADIVVMLLLAVACLAAWPPARRARRVDPAALRREG